MLNKLRLQSSVNKFILPITFHQLPIHCSDSIAWVTERHQAYSIIY